MEPDGNGCLAGDAPDLRFRLLGVPHWHLSTGLSQPLSRKDAALVAILALDGPQARAVLSARLWPDVTEDRAAANLRQRVSRLRRDTGHLFVHTGQSVRLAASVAFDTGSIGDLGIDALVGLGELLAGFDYAENRRLNAWVATQRELLRRQRADALAGHAHRLEAHGELAAALRLSDCILALMPLQEHAWRQQMRLHYLRGDRGSAIQVFERFETLLRSETGARPNEETLALLRLIEASVPGRRWGRAVIPASLQRPPRLVGRRREMQAMAGAWSSGRAFMLVGDLGLGKSRLLADFVQGRSGVLQHRARPGDGQVAFGLLLRLLGAIGRDFLAVTGAADVESLARRQGPDDPALATDARTAELRDRAEALLTQAHAKGLAAVVLDDLHHADRASIEALRWLSASEALDRLPLGVAMRPVADPALQQVFDAWLEDPTRPERIVLSPLGGDDIGTLVDVLDVPAFQYPGLGARLFQHAGGHPLFSLETLKEVLLQDHDLSTDSLPTPIAVRALLERRLGELPARALPLLHVAAIAGPALSVERAVRLVGCSAVDLIGPWSDLESAGVLRGQHFACDMWRESALQRMPPAIRCALHEAMAELLVDERDAAPDTIALHWEAAQRWSQAATCWRKASAAAGHAGRWLEQAALAVRADACGRRTMEPTRDASSPPFALSTLDLRPTHGGRSGAWGRIDPPLKPRTPA